MFLVDVPGGNGIQVFDASSGTGSLVLTSADLLDAGPLFTSDMTPTPMILDYSLIGIEGGRACFGGVSF